MTFHPDRINGNTKPKEVSLSSFRGTERFKAHLNVFTVIALWICGNTEIPHFHYFLVNLLLVNVRTTTSGVLHLIHFANVKTGHKSLSKLLY